MSTLIRASNVVVALAGVRFAIVVLLLGIVAYHQEVYHREAEISRANQERYHLEAVAGRKQILSMELHNEEMLNQHMIRTVERWKLLQEKNPALNVTDVPEPVH